LVQVAEPKSELPAGEGQLPRWLSKDAAAPLPNFICQPPRSAMDAEDLLYSDTRAFSQTCGGCGRSFAQLNAFTNHSSSCARKKRLFSSTLASAQEAYRKQKQRRLEERQKLLFAPDVQEKQPQVIASPQTAIPDDA
jgi:hypothetical protein